MKQYALFLCFLISATAVTFGQDTKIIRGTITDGQRPLADAAVTNLNTSQVYVADARGNYSAEASVGDFLKYSFNGMKDVEIKVEDVTRILNVQLYPEANMLEEVVVEGNKRSQENLKKDYVQNKNIIKTAFGYLDSKKSASNIRVVDMEENNYTYVCIGEVLRARFPELTIYGSCAEGLSIFFRGRGSISNPQPVLYDLDGQVLNTAPIELDVSSIKRIALIRDLATRVLYGANGAGGVIVINTYYPLSRNDSDDSSNSLDRVAQNAKLLPSTNSVNADPNYLLALKDAASLEDAKNIYKEYSAMYASSPYFHLDAYKYFFERGEEAFADELVSSAYPKMFEGNAVLLKALAYHYQEQGRHQKANETLKQVFILRPNYAQSYLDMARSFRDLDKPKLSATMFARYDFLLKENFLDRDSIGFDPIIEREVENLVAMNRNELASALNGKTVARPGDVSGITRMVFEWNDGEAEFDLEFIKGNEQYYIWKHTYDESSDEILREKNYGYNVAEYMIDNTAGYKPWQVNIKYLGNKSLTPTYLKVTTYNNYGSRSQNKDVKVYKLTTKNVNQQLASL